MNINASRGCSQKGGATEGNNGGKLGETGQQSHSQFGPATTSFHSLDQFECKHAKDAGHVSICACVCVCVCARGKSACPE